MRGDGDTVGVREGVREGVGEGETTMQGGRVLSHCLLELRMLLIQQFVTPPGRSAHMGPPHIPHKLGQHTVLPRRELVIPVTQFGSAERGDGVGVLVRVGVTAGVAAGTQGGVAKLQEGAFLRMLLMQQLEAPPRRSAHNPPPHIRQDLAQQAVPLELVPRMPASQSGSILGDGKGDGTVVGGGEVGGTTVKTHGGAFVEQRTPRRMMRPTQQEVAPPGRVAQLDAPHVPQVAGQQTAVVPARLSATIPVEQVGSERGGDGEGN